MSNKKQYLLSCACVIAIFCMGQIPGSIDAAISKITTAFHLSSTTGLYVTTIAALTSVVFSMLVGMIAGKKLGYRKLIYFCAIVEMLGALLPFFGFGTNCLLQFIGGILADISWNYVFLNHILLLIPFAILLFLCPDIDSDTEQPEETTTEHYSPSVFKMWIMMAFVGIIIAPLLIGCSFLSDAIIPSATIAGIVAIFFSLGCMAGGLSYSKLFKLLKQHSLPFSLVVCLIGVIGCGIVRTIPLLCLMIFIGGMGFSTTQASAMMILGLVSSPAQIAMASAGMMSLFNLGMFLSSPFDAVIGMITGDALYMPLYIGGVILLIFAVVFGIKNPFPETSPSQGKKAEAY